MSHPYGRNSPRQQDQTRQQYASCLPPHAPTTPTRPTTLTKPTTLTRPDGTPPASRTYAQNVVHFAPNTPFWTHPAEVDCTLSTTPTIHRTTPPRNGGFYYHRTPVTACRRRVAPLWSQFPPDNKNKRGNRAPHALHRLGSTTPLCGTLLWFLRNVARNSPTRISSFEIASLELQRFGASQKVRAPELRASFGL